MSGARTVSAELQRRIRHARVAYGRCATTAANGMDVEGATVRRKRAPEPNEPSGVRVKRGRE